MCEQSSVSGAWWGSRAPGAWTFAQLLSAGRRGWGRGLWEGAADGDSSRLSHPDCLGAHCPGTRQPGTPPVTHGGRGQGLCPHPRNVPNCKLHRNRASPQDPASSQWGPLFPSPPPLLGLEVGQGASGSGGSLQTFLPIFESHTSPGHCPSPSAMPTGCRALQHRLCLHAWSLSCPLPQSVFRLGLSLPRLPSSLSRVLTCLSHSPGVPWACPSPAAAHTQAAASPRPFCLPSSLPRPP